MDTAELFSRLAVSLGVGLLIGLERGWGRRGDTPGSRTAGVRTFSLSGLLGGMLGTLSHGLDGAGAGLLLGLGFLTFSAVLAAFAREENKENESFSATTTVAGMLTFALGAYAAVGNVQVAAAGAVTVAVLLALREALHRLVASITWEELRAGLMLLAMTFVALPLLPDQDIDALGGINLREIWLVATVLAAVSFCGYAAVKLVGETGGTLLAAAAGGLVSSTAIMVSSARRVAAGETTARLAAAGATLATAVSLLRTLAVVAAINSAVFEIVAVPLGVAALVLAGSALLLAARSQPGRTKQPGTTLRNPFELRVVFGFALLLGVLEMLAIFLAGQFGPSGAVYAALIAGAGDVDAATVSVTRLAGSTISVGQAALAVVAGVTSNNLAKLAMGGSIGRARFALWIAAPPGDGGIGRSRRLAGGDALAGGITWRAACQPEPRSGASPLAQR